MADAKVTAPSKAYRALLLSAGGKEEWFEDADAADDYPGFDLTPAQVKVVDALGSGEFAITIKENGEIGISLTT